VLLAYFVWRRTQSVSKPETVTVTEAQVRAEAKPVEGPASAPQVQPQDVDSAFRQGVELVRAGRTAEGRVELGKVLAARPENEDAWFWLAIACVKEKSYRSAERCFLQARKHGHPEADQALEWLKKQRA
jgi:Tfp pilus assembly protein PilF